MREKNTVNKKDLNKSVSNTGNVKSSDIDSLNHVPIIEFKITNNNIDKAFELVYEKVDLNRKAVAERDVFYQNVKTIIYEIICEFERRRVARRIRNVMIDCLKKIQHDRISHVFLYGENGNGIYAGDDDCVERCRCLLSQRRFDYRKACFDKLIKFFQDERCCMPQEGNMSLGALCALSAKLSFLNNAVIDACTELINACDKCYYTGKINDVEINKKIRKHIRETCEYDSSEFKYITPEQFEEEKKKITRIYTNKIKDAASRRLTHLANMNNQISTTLN